jgi:hypothetical protein
MAQRPFIADVGARFGEWLMTQTSDGDLKVSPVNTNTNSQRAFRADAGLKIGDWKFSEVPSGQPSYHGFNNTNTTYGDYYQRLGSSISANDNYIVVGSPHDRNDNGKISVYDANNYTLLYTVAGDTNTINNTHSKPQFGGGVVICGTNNNKVLVSSEYGHGWGNGNAHIIDLATGTVEHNLCGTGFIGKLSTGSISAHGNYATLGDKDDNSGSGQIHVFDVTTGNKIHTISNPNLGLGSSHSSSSAYDQFGIISATTSQYVAVSATAEDDLTSNSSGKVYVFDINTAQLLYTLDNPNNYGTATDDYFGMSMASNENYLAVSTNDNENANGASVVYVYNIANGSLVKTIDNLPGGGVRSLDMSDNLLGVGYKAGNTNTDIKVNLYALSDFSLAHTINNPDTREGIPSYLASKTALSITDLGKVIVGDFGAPTPTSGLTDFNGAWYVFEGEYSDTMNLKLTPNGTSGSQRPFIVDAGLKIGDWSIVQGLNGHLLASTSAEVVLAGELPQPAISYNFASTSLTNTVSGSSFEDFVGRGLSINGTTLMTSHTGSTPGVKFYDTETGQLSNEFYTSQPHNSDVTGFNSDYYVASHWNEPSGKGTIWIYDMSGNVVKQIVGNSSEGLGADVNVNDTYIISTFASTGHTHKLAVYQIADVLNDNMTPVRTITMPNNAQIQRISNIVNNKVCISESGQTPMNAHVFDISTGELIQTLNNPLSSNSVNDFFGYAMEMTDTHVILNARNNEDSSAADPDLLGYVFEIETGNLVSSFSHPDAESTPNYSYNVNVALNDDYAFFGATRYTNESGVALYSGKVFVFDINTGTLVNTIENPNSAGTTERDFFGQGIAVSGGKLFVGAPNEDNNTSQTGSIYTFSAAVIGN